MIQKSLTAVHLSSTDITIKPLSRRTVQFATTVTPQLAVPLFNLLVKHGGRKCRFLRCAIQLDSWSQCFASPSSRPLTLTTSLILHLHRHFLNWQKLKQVLLKFGKLSPFTVLGSASRKLQTWCLTVFLPSPQIITINVSLGFANFGRWLPIKKNNLYLNSRHLYNLYALQRRLSRQPSTRGLYLTSM